MDKATLLDNLRTERARWDDLLAQVPAARRTLPALTGGWSVRDLIAHITWFEREMVNLLQSRALAGSDLWNLPDDPRNAAIYQQNQDRPLAEVQTEAQAVFQQLLAAVAALDEAALTDPHYFAAMPDDWVPWQLLADNSYEHYQAHTPALRAWLAQ